MKKIILAFLLVPIVCLSQKKIKTEIRTIEGKVEKYLLTWSLSYTVIKLKTEEGNKLARFPSQQGHEIVTKFPTGSSISISVISRILPFDIPNKLKNQWLDIAFADSLVSIQSGQHKINAVWSKNIEPFFYFHEKKRVVLDEIVSGYFTYEGETRGLYTKSGSLIFENLLFRSQTKFKEIPIGSTISNFGAVVIPKPGEELVASNATKIIHAKLLYKASGTISSFLFKQNGACIGLTLDDGAKIFKLYFPTELTEKIMDIEKRKAPITIYYDPLMAEPKNNLYPSLHAIVSKNDTLKIEREFFGDPDGKHDYNNSTHKGKITKLNRDLKNRIVSIILDDKILIEANDKIQTQLTSILKRGKMIKVDGQERIKKEGEVYQNGYAVVVPKKVTIEDKEFLVEK